MPFDHFDCRRDVAAMADLHHLVFELALWRRRRLALQRHGRWTIRDGFQSRHNLRQLTIARACQRRVVANLSPEPSRPAFSQWIGACFD